MKFSFDRVAAGLSRNFRNTINSVFGDIENNFKETDTKLTETKANADSALTKSDQAVSKAINVQAQVDALVIGSNTSPAETVQARVDEKNRTFNTVKQRIDTGFTEVTAQLADKAKQKQIWNNENFVQRGGITPKLIQNVSDTYFITTQKPNKKGYVRFRLRQGVVTTNESVGGQGELLRCVEVVEVAESFLMTNTPSAKSDPTIFTTTDLNYVILGVGQQSIPSAAILTKTAGAWIEYQVTTPRGIREVEALVYGSSGSSDNVNVSVDGTNVMVTSFMKTTSGFFKMRIPLPTSGSHTIRFTTVTAANMTIAGVNLVDLKDSNGYSYDYPVNINNTNGNQYVTSSGSMDYALLDADTNLWCGSYHGGETRSRLLMLVDGTPFTLTDGQFKLGNVIEIEQDTSIVNKINAYSRQRFQSDGEIEFQVVFGGGSIKLKTLFTNMSTTLDSYTDILYPLKDSLSEKERVVLPEGVNYIVQKNPTNNQTCTTILNNNKLGSDELPFIKKLIGSYCKVYNSNIQSDTGVQFTGGQFRVCHIFN